VNSRQNYISNCESRVFVVRAEVLLGCGFAALGAGV
jgi:hypothetical protein